MENSSTAVPWETRAPAVHGTIIAEAVLSITFVALRLQARRVSFGYLRLDLSDWLTISALLFALAYFIVVAVGTVFGFGRHIETVTDARRLYILSLLSNVFDLLALASLKLSILALYRSIFPSSRFHRAVTALASLVVAWAVANLILGLVLCIPIESLWDKSIPHAHCLAVSVFQLIMISVHIGIELLILFLPIPSVLRLQVSAERKRLIILTFVVGGTGCIVSIARIPVWVLSESADVSWQLVVPALLAATELMVGFLAVSFPVYRPLFKKSAYANDTARDLSVCHLGVMVTDEVELMRPPNISGW
ncbi:hypothetical protein O1611_g3680 [Lasiodiplodia mahajangana]|uniref:Uncharacterized protein n=1 Tax=Lasiodiplodia mahajangana TaxID=1108764 RepID=A0ACC2JRG6_9PEZI|nr:hypothetical protein O1611_g3680 [Lasiodiplodia mahajangana]